MKNTGNSQQWACDVVTNDFDQEFIDQLRILTDNDILLVPRRLKGITSGQNGRCYWNANICAQTWGGKVLYGWGISFIGDSPDAGIFLYGHACWLTPEGKLVDPTYCPGVSESFFVPYTDKLIINGRVTESICDLCYPKSEADIDFLLCIASCEHGKRLLGGKDEHGYYYGMGVNYSRCLKKIVYCNALPYDFVVKEMEGLDFSIQEKVHRMFSPFVTPIDQGVPKKLIHDPSLTPTVMQQRFIVERKSICSMYTGYDVTAHWMGADMVWDCSIVRNPPLVNRSLKTGKSIQDIAPLQEIVDKHSLPTQKKRLQKVVATSEQYNLTPQEVVMLSNPFLYPHPHLMSKAGWESIPRIKTADLIAD